MWFTGLSGSGKTTTARAVAGLLRQMGRQAAVFDGDEIRARFSADLGFSAGDRRANTLRVAALARDAACDGGVAICALISPYRAARGEARLIVSPAPFVEVFVDTPLAVCEARDPKGLYARARAGQLPSFTGVDDPYEPPERPELVIHGGDVALEVNARAVVELLASLGVVERS